MTLAQRRRLLMRQGKLPVAKPVVSGAKTYNGAAQSVTLAGYDSATMTLGGTQSAVNAGNYAVTVALKDTTKYQWADGTTDTISLSWRINKAANSITVSPNSVTISQSSGWMIYATAAHPGTYYVDNRYTDYVQVGINSSTGTGTVYLGSVYRWGGNYTVYIGVAASTNYSAATAAVYVSVS